MAKYTFEFFWKSRWYNCFNRRHTWSKYIFTIKFLLHVSSYWILQTIKIGESTPFKKYNSTFWRKRHPGCENYDFDSNDYWKCCLHNYASSLHHHSGTCKMGPITDRDSVVSHELKVHGVIGLRVVDASIFPIIPASHTNSVVYMVAEKAADMVKSEWLTFGNNSSSDNFVWNFKFRKKYLIW